MKPMVVADCYIVAGGADRESPLGPWNHWVEIAVLQDGEKTCLKFSVSNEAREKIAEMFSVRTAKPDLRLELHAIGVDDG